MTSLEPYKKKSNLVRANFARELASGNKLPLLLSIHRDILNKMEEQLKSSSQSVFMYGTPDEWHAKIIKEIDEKEKKLDDLRFHQLSIFFKFAETQISKAKSEKDYVVSDKYNGITY